MAILGGKAKFRELDSNGDPLSSGKLYTYEPGTTTNKATYTDSTEGTSNANPVVLDSRGEADVWFNGKYKLVLKDSSDTTIWTVDNYDPQTLDLTNGILDANGNELVTFSTTSSAVNHIQIANQSTGNSPTISAVGEDDNIDLTLAAKGTGVISFSSDFSFSDTLTIAGVAANSAQITLGEDTSNGSNTITLKAPQSIASDRELTFPTAAPTNGYLVQTDGSGIWTYVDVTSIDLTGGVSAASDSTAGKIEIATQAETETGSSTTLATTPGRQHYHLKHPKAWLNMNGTGTIGINADQGVTSLVDNGTGDYTVNLDDTYTANQYAVIATAVQNDPVTNGDDVADCAAHTLGTGSFILNTSDNNDDGNVDAETICVVVLGDIS